MSEHNHPPGEGCPACLETAREGFADATKRIAELQAELADLRLLYAAAKPLAKDRIKWKAEYDKMQGWEQEQRARAEKAEAELAHARDGERNTLDRAREQMHRAEKAEAEVERIHRLFEEWGIAYPVDGGESKPAPQGGKDAKRGA